MVLPRTPIPRYGEEDVAAEEAEEIDLSMLPPG
jgi:acetolactate synthase-1/3 small subunit